MKEIRLTRGYVALVDDEDFPLVSAYRWRTKCWRRYRYAHTRGPRLKGKESTIFMHRLIMGNPQGMEVDHINGNGLDNRRCNLRVVTTSQNQANQHARRGRSSFKGVFKQRSRWRARIHVQQKGINLGSFLTEEEAARAYDAAALHYFGEHACLNFPRQEGAA